MSNSTHKVEVVPIKLLPHSNADSLSIIPVFDQYQVVGRTSDWEGKMWGAYIPPDSLVDTKRPEFSFLVDKARADGFAHIRGIKLRGEVSYGMMVPIPEGMEVTEGQDLTEFFGVEHWNRPEPREGGKNKDKLPNGETESGPPGIYKSKYDLEAGEKYGIRMFEGKEVVVHEKLEGENFAAVFEGLTNRMYVSSRTLWKREYPCFKDWTRETLIEKGIAEDKIPELLERFEKEGKRRSKWWQVLTNVPQIEAFCRAFPGFLVYGEAYGTVGGYPYDTGGKVSFRAFDITTAAGKFMDYDDARIMADSVGLPWAPELYRGSFDAKLVKSLASGMTTLGGKNIKEGCVCRTIKEELHPRYGRSILKWKGEEYILRKKD